MFMCRSHSSPPRPPPWFPWSLTWSPCHDKSNTSKSNHCCWWNSQRPLHHFSAAAIWCQFQPSIDPIDGDVTSITSVIAESTDQGPLEGPIGHRPPLSPLELVCFQAKFRLATATVAATNNSIPSPSLGLLNLSTGRPWGASDHRNLFLFPLLDVVSFTITNLCCCPPCHHHRFLLWAPRQLPGMSALLIWFGHELSPSWFGSIWVGSTISYSLCTVF